MRQANETRLLRKLLNQDIGITPIETGNLIISGDEAVKWLRVVYESKLLQNLAKSGTPLVTPDLAGFSLFAGTVQHNLAVAPGIKFVANLAKESSGLRVSDLESLTQEVKQIFHALQVAVEFRQMEQLRRIPPAFEAPPLQILASNGKIACDSLRKANDFMILRQLNSYKPVLALPNTTRFEVQARFILKRLKTGQETKVLIKIFKSERNRKKIIKNCYYHAEWAGSNLRRWDRVFAEYKKYPKKLKILNRLIDEAHSRFLGIMAETKKLMKFKLSVEMNHFCCVNSIS